MFSLLSNLSYSFKKEMFYFLGEEHGPLFIFSSFHGFVGAEDSSPLRLRHFEWSAKTGVDLLRKVL